MADTTWTLTEAAERCGVPRPALQRKLAAGGFPHASKGAGGAWRIPLTDLVAAGFAPDEAALSPEGADQPTPQGPRSSGGTVPPGAAADSATDNSAENATDTGRHEGDAAGSAHAEQEHARLLADLKTAHRRVRELEARNAELGAQGEELSARVAELEAQNTELSARADELTGRVRESARQASFRLR